MVEEQTLAYVNTGLATMLFSMLIIGMSIKFSDMSVLAAWADARSFANAMSTRPYTSADCFAYETGVIRYDESLDEMVTERRVYPHVIDVRKFTNDRYFDCVQNYYFGEISHVEGLADTPAISAFFFEFDLMDYTDPFALKQFGSSHLSTREQLDFSEAAMLIDALRANMAFFGFLLEHHLLLIISLLKWDRSMSDGKYFSLSIR